MYQEPYQAAAAASVAGGYQSQGSQDASTAASVLGSGSGSGGGAGTASNVAAGNGPQSLFSSVAAVANAGNANAECIKYPQEF